MHRVSEEWFSVSVMGDMHKRNVGEGTQANDVLNYWKHIGYIIFLVGMVLGAHIGYVFQLYDMYRTRNVEGYSPLVSLILLTSNSIRILYYVGNNYALALLFQAIFAVLVHGILILEVLHIIHYVTDSNQCADPNIENAEDLEQFSQPDIVPKKRSLIERLDTVACNLEESMLGLTPASFLRTACMWGLLITISVMVYYATIGSFWHAAPELIGYLSLGIEALLVLPQILRNKRRSSTEGLTMLLVLTWVLGDIIKLIYFILDHQPIPFTVCACFQICLDVIVVAQVVYYRNSR